MQLTQKQLNAAVDAGLVITDPENSPALVPMKHNAGALILNQILVALSAQKIMLSVVPPKEDPNPEVAEAVAKALAEGEETPAEEPAAEEPAAEETPAEETATEPVAEE